ncbi:MAG: glycosyltransferase [Candidatus Hydrogenedentes bacterium]|nr:glycosyltransferase [Candidatus Hydrogenedentota bacterium]
MRVALSTIVAKHRPDTGHEERYLRRVMTTARKVQQDTEFIVLTHEGNHDSFEGWERVLVHEGGGMLTSLRGGSAIERAARQAKADVLLTAIDTATAGPPLPQVLYALDFAPWETVPGEPPGHKVPDTKVIKKAAASALTVIAPSEYLRRRCLELFETPLDRVMVAHPGVEHVFQEPHGTMVGQPYLVAMTASLTGSSLDRVLETLDQLTKEIPHTFVIVGRSGAPEPDDWGPRVVRIEHLPDNHLAGLYQNGEAFLYAGLFDGSAVRVLEALHAGIPVVAPNSGAIPELAGKHPIYYNPASTATMIQGMRRALDEDKKARIERIRLTRSATSRYNWEKCAWRFLSALKRM